MSQSDQINEIVGALAKAQGEMKGAVKDTANTFFKTQYATLASALEACREPLSKNGLAVVQTTETTDVGNVNLKTILAHSSGQYFTSTYPILPTKNDPQGFGSALTYGRRYCLMAIVGIAPEDDDGESASGRGESKDAPVRQPAKTPPKAPTQPKASPTTNAEQDWADLAQKIKKDIDDAPSANRLGDIAESKDLAELEAYNKITGQFMRDRIKKRAVLIANGGRGEAPTKPQNSEDVPF